MRLGSLNIKGCFKKDSRVLQGKLKGVSMFKWVVSRLFKRSSMVVCGKERCFKVVSTKF